MKIYQIITMLALCGPLTNAAALDLSSCQDNLDRLKRASSSAADAASEANAKVETADRCKSDRSSYEYRYDQCRGKSSDARNALSDLKSALDDVDSKVKRVSADCGYEVNGRPYGGISSKQTTGDSHCDGYREYLGRLPYQTLMATCSQYMAADQCKKCLEFKPNGK
ncbi:hypothetical protein D3C87_224230 [compost metagenome]